jgi:hypothetical protein
MKRNNRNESLTIGTTALVVSVEKNNENAIRESIIIINTSTAGQIITLSINAEAVAGQGIVLHSGGSWIDSADSGYLPTQHSITAISSAVGGTIAIQERTINKGV